MSERLEQLLDEFAVRYRRGESPDLRDYLARAGDEADAFARLADALLQSVPVPPPSEEKYADWLPPPEMLFEAEMIFRVFQ